MRKVNIKYHACEKGGKKLSIGSRLREWRKKNNLNTTDLHDSTGISLGALSNYENDKREISSNFLLKIRELYNADIYYILTGVKNDLINLSENEKELLLSFNKLTEREQIKWIGKIEQATSEIEEIEKTQSLSSRTG